MARTCSLTLDSVPRSCFGSELHLREHLLTRCPERPRQPVGLDDGGRPFSPLYSANVVSVQPGELAQPLLRDHRRRRLRRSKISPASDNTTIGAARAKVRRLRIILRNASVSLRCGNGLFLGTPTPRNLHKGSQPSFTSYTSNLSGGTRSLTSSLCRSKILIARSRFSRLPPKVSSQIRRSFILAARRRPGLSGAASRKIGDEIILRMPYMVL